MIPYMKESGFEDDDGKLTAPYKYIDNIFRFEGNKNGEIDFPKSIGRDYVDPIMGWSKTFDSSISIEKEKQYDLIIQNRYWTVIASTEDHSEYDVDIGESGESEKESLSQ